MIWEPWREATTSFAVVSISIAADELISSSDIVFFAELEAGGFSLDYCGFPKATETVLPPDELLADYYKKKALSEEKISKILAEFEAVLRKSE